MTTLYTKPTQFFFFGCWNYDNCPTTYVTSKEELKEFLDYRKGVIDMVLDNIRQYDFGIIAGDNAYAQKKEDGKYYFRKTLTYGFSLLESLNKQLLGVLGNHDIHHPDILELQLEKEFFKLPSNNYVQIINNLLRVIVIDTNIFTKIDEKIYKSKQYISELRKLFNWLKNTLKTKFYGWTVVVGHQPIFSYKSKIKIELLHQYETLMNILSNYDKVIYMCADIHQFQAWNIPWENKFIPMIVAGTGGAEPDPVIKPSSVSQISMSIGDKITNLKPVIVQDAYGYCSVTVTEKNFIVNYIPLGCKINNDSFINNLISLEYKDNKFSIKEEIIIPEQCPATPILLDQCIETKDIILKKFKNK